MDSDDDEGDIFMMDDDFELFDIAIGVLEAQIEGKEELHNEGGSIRKVRRDDYSRGPKRPKSELDPWIVVPWLLEIRDPQTMDPAHRKGKEFRRRFRVPLPVFLNIVLKCKMTGEKEFNYPPKMCTHQFTIPLELKILYVLRVLGGGCHSKMHLR